LKANEEKTMSWRRAGCWLAVLLLCACAAKEKAYTPVELPTAKNVILISIDALRADRVGANGYSRPTTPNLDKLAGEGIRFAEAYSSSNWTAAGHAGLLTGLMSSGHGAARINNPIRPEVPLVSERFAQAGFATAAFVSHVFVSERYGFQRGFTTFNYEQNCPSPRLIDKTVAWLDQQPRDQRFFLFLHDFDVHTPYGKAGAPVERFAGKECRGPVSNEALFGANLLKDWEKYACYSDLYDANIALVDRDLGRLFAHLRRAGLDDETLIVVTADHGELMGRGEGVIHGITLFDKELRVPLIVRPPHGAAGHTVIRDRISTIQLAPYLLEAAGLPPLAGDLPSLSAVLRGQPAPRWIAAETSAHGYDQIAIIEQNHKLLLPPVYRLLGQLMAPMLVDFTQDERTDLAAQKPEVLQRLFETARQSGWYGTGTCYEIAYRLKRQPGTVFATVTLPEGAKPVYVRPLTREIAAGKKVVEKDHRMFYRLTDNRVEILTHLTDDVQGVLVVVDPPEAPVTVEWTAPELASAVPFTIGPDGKKADQPRQVFNGPLGAWVDLNYPNGEFVRLHAYPVLHLYRPGAGPSPQTAELNPDEIKMLKALGYIGM
jgi:arylsulfatase